MDRIGQYTDSYGVITYQVGEESLGSIIQSPFCVDNTRTLMRMDESLYILPRGGNNHLPEEIERNVKSHRLLPSIFEKQSKILLGEGIGMYKSDYSSGKLVRKWEDIPNVRKWLNSWTARGLSEDAEDLMLSIITAYYWHGDYFVKWRFSNGKQFGALPVSGLQLVENRKSRLATTIKQGVGLSVDDYSYDDFNKVLVGNWRANLKGYKVYPLLKVSDLNNYNYAAISHHANIDVGNIYGWNRCYEGAKEWLLLSNDNVKFVKSFLNNSLAARIHVIIPNEWVQAKKQSIMSFCDENILRQSESKELLTFNGIEVGTTFRESSLKQYIDQRMSSLSDYLSGPRNQGKAFTSESFMNQDGKVVEWRIEPIDLKYKEYISSLIDVDRRSDEVITSAVGIDPSITNISKEGVISKSGSDAYYNYMIYINQLGADEKICCDAYNMALQINFPQVYAQGYRIGLYRSIIERQQDVSPTNRI